MSWSNTIEQQIQNPDPVKAYLNQENVKAATEDGTEKGTEFQFDQTTKNIDKSTPSPEEISNNKEIPERAQKRYEGLLWLNPEKDQLIHDYMETINFQNDLNKNNTDFDLIGLLLEKTNIQELKNTDESTKHSRRRELMNLIQLDLKNSPEPLTFIKKILTGKINIQEYNTRIQEIHENPETSNTEKAEKAKEYSHETIKKATEVEEILYGLDPKSEDFSDIIQLLKEDEKYNQQLKAKWLLSPNNTINTKALQKLYQNKPENSDASIGKSIIEMIKKEQAIKYLEEANKKNTRKYSDELYNFVGKTLEKVNQTEDNPLFEEANTILQTNQKFLNEMFKNVVFVNNLPKLIEAFKTENKDILLANGYTTEDLQKLTIENIQEFSKRNNQNEEDPDDQKQEYLQTLFFATKIINEESINKYSNALYLQKKGRKVSTLSAFNNNTTKLSPISLKWIDKFSQKTDPNKGRIEKENKDKEPSSTSSKEFLQLSPETKWIDFVKMFEKNNANLKGQIAKIDRSLQDTIKGSIRTLTNTQCKKRLDKTITTKVQTILQGNQITTNADIKRTDFISEKELSERIANKDNNVSLNFSELDKIFPGENRDKAKEVLKTEITNEIKNTLNRAIKQQEREETFTTNIETNLNKQTIGNIIDQISKTLDENESTKGFSIDVTDTESFKIDDKYIILKGKYGESECSFFYELSSGEVKVSSSFTNDENQITFDNKTPNITICKFPNFKEYKEIWLNSIKGLRKKIQKGNEGEELQKQFNQKIEVTKENMKDFLLQNEKSKLFTNFINILDLKDPSLSKEKNPDHYQFFIDVSNAIHTPEEARQINTFITRIATQKKLIMENTKEGKNITDTSEIMRKLFNLEKQKDDEKHLHDSQFNQNSLVLLLTHFIRKTTDQSSENGWTINTFRIEDMNRRMESFTKGDQAITDAEKHILGKSNTANTDTKYWEYKTTSLVKYLNSR